jgi:hypothetical protein
MVVLSPVPAKHGGNMEVRLDDDPAPTPRPLARPRPVHALPDVFSFPAGSLARARVAPTLAPNRAVRTTCARGEQLDPVIAFLALAPRVELFQRAPLVGRTPSPPVVRDAPQPVGGFGVDGFGLRGCDYCRIVVVEGWSVRPCGGVDRECAEAAFESWDCCWG